MPYNYKIRYDFDDQLNVVQVPSLNLNLSSKESIVEEVMHGECNRLISEHRERYVISNNGKWCRLKNNDNTIY